jgi:hypothetical protein
MSMVMVQPSGVTAAAVVLAMPNGKQGMCQRTCHGMPLHTLQAVIAARQITSNKMFANTGNVVGENTNNGEETLAV